MVPAQCWKSIVRDISELISDSLCDRIDSDSLYDCGEAVTEIIRHRPEEVKDLAHSKLHTWPFKDVPLCWRRAYEEASLYEALSLLLRRDQHGSNTQSKRSHDGSIKLSVEGMGQRTAEKLTDLLDMAIILTAAPLRRELIDVVFGRLQCYLDEIVMMHGDEAISTTFPHRDPSANPVISFGIPVRENLPLSKFQLHLDSAGGPLVITDAVTHWPAHTLWSSPLYLHQRALHGRRLVPIELGRSYTDDSWSQRIMPFSAYLRDYLLPSSPSVTGYLAQHDLLDQIPALSNDTLTPDLCYADPPDSSHNLEEPLRNAWLGPGGTISPLHTDPYHNILCQVVGRKYIRLYAPGESKALHPRGEDEAGVDMGNTSAVDVSRARQLETAVANEAEVAEFEAMYPGFRKANYLECILEAGQALYIPKGWWHYVESLEVSFNVSYWFD